MGLYNPKAFQFVATNLTDMKAKETVEHEGNITAVLQPEQVKKEAEQQADPEQSAW